jgi:hypothetical protein
VFWGGCLFQIDVEVFVFFVDFNDVLHDGEVQRPCDHEVLSYKALRTFGDDFVHQVSLVESLLPLHDSSDGALRQNLSIVVEVLEQLLAVDFDGSVDNVVQVDGASVAVRTEQIEVPLKLLETFHNSLFEVDLPFNFRWSPSHCRIPTSNSFASVSMRKLSGAVEMPVS